MLKPTNQSARSTIWNSWLAGSKLLQIRSDRRNVIADVHSATARAFCATTSGSPRISRMKAAPASGRKITRESSGQSLMRQSSPDHEHVPGDKERNPDQHGKGVVIEVAGLEANRAPRDVDRDGGEAVGAVAIDHAQIAALP